MNWSGLNDLERLFIIVYIAIGLWWLFGLPIVLIIRMLT